jgi:hypothetical protein
MPVLPHPRRPTRRKPLIPRVVNAKSRLRGKLFFFIAAARAQARPQIYDSLSVHLFSPFVVVRRYLPRQHLIGHLIARRSSRGISLILFPEIERCEAISVFKLSESSEQHDPFFCHLDGFLRRVSREQKFRSFDRSIVKKNITIGVIGVRWHTGRWTRLAACGIP